MSDSVIGCKSGTVLIVNVTCGTLLVFVLGASNAMSLLGNVML